MNRSEAHIEKIGEVVLNFNYYDGTDHYSEGVHEDILLDYVKKYDESEYERIILGSRLWSVMYHLSKRRENIVSFLPVDRSMSVLEIGSGCGAVTGALSELAGRVTCIELSGKRSRINAERHKNRDNIEIIVGNFRDIEPELDERYDVITLIGVLEYAESYIGGQDPYIGLIKRASEHLAENGILVIAIENKYGLKYFAGCKEDHTGRFFEGLEGYPSSEGVRTFSRDGLR
ncbi:MAG TPA: SAM-dependent methyltransferase, partial [Lachnospiraceae bacterium]|nr:SAM-dependent methyltransferase [Lachnospiraceae bacterium]